MKKTNLLLLVLCIISFQLNAQSFLDRVANKALKKVEEKVEQKADEKIDKGIDKGLNAIEESFEKEEDTSTKKDSSITSTSNSSSQDFETKMTSFLLKKVGIDAEPIDIEDMYQFKSSSTASMKYWDSLSVPTSSSEIVTYFSPGERNFAYQFINHDTQVSEDDKGLFIWDYENKATIILSEDEGEKTGFVMGTEAYLDEATSMNEETDSDLPESTYMNPNVNKTGKTKKILGYSCEEFAYTDSLSVSSIWVAKDLVWESGDYMSNVLKTASYTHGMPKGMLMESNTLNLESKGKSQYLITELLKNANRKIKMDEYDITNIGNIKVPDIEEE